MLSSVKNIFEHIGPSQSHSSFGFLASKDGIYQQLGQSWASVL